MYLLKIHKIQYNVTYLYLLKSNQNIVHAILTSNIYQLSKILVGRIYNKYAKLILQRIGS